MTDCLAGISLACTVPIEAFMVPWQTDRNQLTHISLASFLWDIGKKRGVPSGAILFAYIIFIE